MSFRDALTSLNAPPVVATAGVALFSGSMGFWLSSHEKMPATLSSNSVLHSLNAMAFVVNVIAVSIPGRIDQQQQQQMLKQSGSQTDATTNDTKPNSSEMEKYYSPSRGRSLVTPSGWAFAIWGPIYVGELVWVTVGQFVLSRDNNPTEVSKMTVPFVTANLLQSLWCAAFRPSYNHGLALYVSPFLLAGTAASLSLVHVALKMMTTTITTTTTNKVNGWFLLPLTLHFGWTTAASLVNLNGSIASNPNVSDSVVIAAGHASAVVATVLGIAVTWYQHLPAYGATIAWALAACASGMQQRLLMSSTQNNKNNNVEGKATEMTGLRPGLSTGANVQRHLCWLGSGTCAFTALYVACFKTH